jgi:RNA polymerase sigma-70 factor (ECF subfamily)
MDETVEARDDCDLLRAIAGSRDHDAYTELYKRYEARAFNLALRVLHNSALAQEAVQDAMLSIWRTTESSLPSGNAKDWIMRIVMNKSINVASSHKQLRKREERVVKEQSRSATTVEADSENAELIASLRAQIDQLPDFERTVLAYSYCTGVSQEEIAKLVGVSQRTVSTKIQQALTRLRTGLVSGGFAATAAHLVSAENLFEAMTTGQKCPTGMFDRLTRRMESQRLPARGRSRKMATAKSGGMAWPMLIGASFVAGIAALLVMGKGPQPVPTVTQPQKVEAPAEQPQPAQPPTVAEPLYKCWEFQNAPAQDLKVVDGNWKWVAGAHEGKGAMLTVGTATILIPDSAIQSPITITVTGHTEKNGDSPRIGATICWFDGANVRKNRWSEVDCGSVKDGAAYEQKAVCLGNYIIFYYFGKCVGVKEFQNAGADGHLYLSLNNLAVSKIEMRSLKESELTEELRNPERIISMLRKDPSFKQGDQSQ